MKDLFDQSWASSSKLMPDLHDEIVLTQVSEDYDDRFAGFDSVAPGPCRLWWKIC